jgi:hypothetical protein
MTLAELIARAQEELRTALAERQARQDALLALRSDDNLTEEAVTAAVAARDAADQVVTQRQGRLEQLEAEEAREQEIAALQARVSPTGVRAPAYDRVARVGAEERTYRQDQDPRGVGFVRDAVHAMLGDYGARDRLAQHMREESVERAEYIAGGQQRAVGTGAFTGLVVPQYLTEAFAPMATAGRPFADACRHHDLPPQGMTVNLGRGTTGTSAADQANEGDQASETNYDDTLLTINVRTSAGRQTISRQAIDRGAGIEDTIMEDLIKRNAANVDSALLNTALIGATAVATSVAYTDASPTTAELYPKVIEGLAGVEGALLDVASGENIAVMHSRRWYWMQNAMGTSYPLITQPGIVAQTLGANYATRYGQGVRGILPNGTPVIVDNNIAVNLGAGNNEDEIYLGDRNECHLWEDPNAPLWLRADIVDRLQVEVVVFEYYAFTHARYAHLRKVAGTGLVTPVFAGV